MQMGQRMADAEVSVYQLQYLQPWVWFECPLQHADPVPEMLYLLLIARPSFRKKIDLSRSAASIACNANAMWPLCTGLNVPA